jgi:hypothetical protein
MFRISSLHGGDEKWVQHLVENPEGKRQLGRQTLMRG